jgi:type III restriction enzyme
MENPFFEHPILDSPYECRARRWELDAEGQLKQQTIEAGPAAKYITPVAKPRKRKKGAAAQEPLVFNEGAGGPKLEQLYDPAPIAHELRHQVDQWRRLPHDN